jgi:GT2 family glycosyltransferase
MKITIGFITYKDSSFKYLPLFSQSLLDSLNKARELNSDLEVSVLAFDNSDDAGRDNYDYLRDFFEKNNLDGKIWDSKENIGFSRAYNIMINHAIDNGADLFLMLNPDTLLESSFVEEMISAYEKDPEVGVWAPKILYWDFPENKKSNIIDSYGTGLSRSHRFFDRGQGKRASSFSDESKEIFGFTGAAALLNLKLLKRAAYEKDSLMFFDELMFMYKEDIDLSYRLQLLGIRIVFNPQAVVYHHRSLSSFKIRLSFFKKRKSRAYSFLNQLIILHKIRKLKFSFKTKMAIFFRFLMLSFYGSLFHREQLLEFSRIKKDINSDIFIFENANSSRIERFMKDYN